MPDSEQIGPNQYYQHPAALVESSHIGAGTNVWAFAHILPGATIGSECNICDHVFIENSVTVGDRVTIKCGVQLWDGIQLEDDVFVGPNVTFTNDRFPRSKHHPESYPVTRVCAGASIGANATILPALVIGENALVGAGSVVTRDVPRNAIVTGNPARITGYVNALSRPERTPLVAGTEVSRLGVTGASLVQLPEVVDIRGGLTFGEIEAHLPFIPKRFFLVYGVPTREVRGEHAHKRLNEFLICIRGNCSVMVDSGYACEEVILNSPSVGLHVPPLLWRVHYKYSADAILLSLCSEKYDADDYIRDYEDFLTYSRSINDQQPS